MNSGPAQAAPVRGLVVRVVALVMALVALTQPYWSYSAAVGPSGSWLKVNSEFYGDRMTAATYTSDGTLRDQKVVYYSDPDFGAHDVAMVMGNENWLVVALAVFAGLGVPLALPPLRRPQLRPLAILFDLLLLVVAVGAPTYLAVAIGQAANADLSHSISGFLGSATGGGGFVAESWGPALGWFIVLGASILALFGLALGLRQARAALPAPQPP